MHTSRARRFDRKTRVTIQGVADGINSSLIANQSAPRKTDSHDTEGFKNNSSESKHRRKRDSKMLDKSNIIKYLIRNC